MIKYLIVICLISINRLYGQYNLVPNPSFEQCVNCPTNGGAEIGAQFTNNVILPYWNNPSNSLASPDYYYFNLMGENAIDGNSMVGIVTFISACDDSLYVNFVNGREYLQSELLDSLQNDKIYLIDFYTYVGGILGQGNFLANNVGIHFSDTLLHTSNFFNIPLTPQIKYFNNEIIQEINSWTKFSGIYIAAGSEKYMTIGNFNTDLETDFICLSPFWPATGKCYMLFDNFSVTPLDSIPGGLQVNAGQDYTICPGDTVFIGEKISNLPANWYLLDGTVVDTNTAGVYVHPTVTTTYVVTMTINGVYSTDTVTVTVGCAGVNEPEKPKFSIGPNPNDGEFLLSGAFHGGEILLICTSDGKEVYRSVFADQTKELHVQQDFNPGVYFVLLQNAQGSLIFSEKMVVKN